MVKLIATSVVRGSQQGESHGGVYIVDFEKRTVAQPIDWNTMDIDWRGRGWDRGLRGIAIYDKRIFIAASDELFEYDPDFNLVGSYRNQYLKHAHEITRHHDHLFITSTAFDSILMFNLKKNEFERGLYVRTDGVRLNVSQFNPVSDEGPMPLNKMHINNVHCAAGGMYVSGLKTDLIFYNGRTTGVTATLPKGSHNARPYRNGVLLNDTQANCVRYAARDAEGNRVFGVPVYPDNELTGLGLDDTRIARQGFGRGLCPITDTLIAAGSSPSTITLHDLDGNKTVASVALSKDIRNAIHGLEVWPF
ncbi:MAG: hypothetical protein AAF224_00095 [Pseudomonadota bacterium]